MGNKVSFTFLATNAYSRIAKQVSKSTASVRKNFRGLGKEVKKQNTAIGKSTKFLSGKFKALAASAAGFFGAREFLRIGSQFQDSMADLSAITGATGKDFDALRDKTLGMAKASVTSQAEVAEAIKLVASAKPDLLENLDALTATTKQVLLLKNAAGIDLAQAANITAQGLNIFGAEASQAGKFVNILAAGAKLGSSEIAETGEAMLLAGPAARGAGLDFAQLNAAIQTVAKGGIKGSQAGTALNAIFGRLRRQGIDFKKLGLEGAFEKIRVELDAIKDPTKRALAEAKRFGDEHSKVGLAILNNVGLLGQYNKSLRGTNIAQEQADIRLATFSAKMRLMGIVIKDKLIRLFERLEPTITKNVEKFTAFIDTLKTEDIDKFATSLHGVWEVLKLVGDAVKFIASIFKGVGTGIGEFIGQIATGNFSADIATSFTDAFSVGGNLFGLIENAPKMDAGGLTAGQASRTDINMNIRAPEGAIESVKSTTTGQVSGMNVGMNMATVQ